MMETLGLFVQAALVLAVLGGFVAVAFNLGHGGERDE